MARPTKSTVDSIKNWILDVKGDLEWLKEEGGYKGFKLLDHLESGSSIHHTEHHIFRVPKRYALLNIDDIVSAVVQKSGVYDGFIFLSSMHTTSAVIISDSSQGLLHDIARTFTDLAPYSTDQWEHHRTASEANTDNGDAHIKNLLLHSGVQIPITKGKLDIGPDQYPWYAEFEGKKEKRIIMKVTGIKRPDGGSEQKQGGAAAASQPTGGAPAEKKAFRTYD